ncbi:MAG TPA: hypothetical protein VIT90_12140 [Lysobacter sp.]
MRASRLDLHRGNRPALPVAAVSLLGAVIALVATMQYLDVLRDRGQALDARESAISRQESSRRLIGNAHRSAADPLARDLMARQRFAMEPARDLIERGWHPGIAFLALELATDTRQINMVFETRSAQEALAYVDWLEVQPATERVLVKRQSARTGAQFNSMETSLQIIWRSLHADPPKGETPARSSRPPSSPSGQR